jgi:hypothetical protein
MNWVPGARIWLGERPSLQVSPSANDKKALHTFWFCSQHVDAQSTSAEQGPVMNCVPGAMG